MQHSAEMVNMQFPSVPPEQQQATLRDAIAGYQTENAALFFIIEPSIVLEGHWELSGTVYPPGR